MDTLTHGAVGWLIARSGRGGAPGRGSAATLACVAGAVLPDADYALYAWGTEAYLRHHRGLSHCLPFGILLTLGVALGAAVVRRRSAAAAPTASTAPTRLAWMTFAGYASHALLDLVTPYGTLLLAPFSDYRFALDWLFVVDPTVSVIAVTALLLGRRGRPVERAVAAARAGLLVLAAYLALAAACHARAEFRLREDFAPPVAAAATVIAALPSPGGPFRWTGLALTPDAVVRCTLRLGRPTEPRDETPRELPSGDPLIHAADETEVVRCFRWFARFPVATRRSDAAGDRVEYFDLRFADVPGRRPFLLRVRFDPAGRPHGHEVLHDAW